MDIEARTTFLLVDTGEGERVHRLLKSNGWLEAHVEPLRTEPGKIGFPLLPDADGPAAQTTAMTNLNVASKLMTAEVPRRDSVDPHHRLSKAVHAWLAANDLPLQASLLVPSKWERLGDLALLPHEWRTSEAWPAVRDHPEAASLWNAIAGALKVGALGIQAPVANDTFRSSQVEMLLGASTVEFTDHGMTYTFDAAKVMFSSGNVTERRRIGALDMDGEVVVDAYAGVGYYTFPILVHAGAAHVHACEINPASLDGLRAGAAANGLLDRLTVHEGDNQASLTNLRGIADRCHLGLLPSSEPAWEPCLLALKPTGGVLHVHMNVEEENIDAWTTATVNTFETLVAQHGLNFSVRADHLERVKWFAPRVRHVVLDLSFRP